LYAVGGETGAGTSSGDIEYFQLDPVDGGIVDGGVVAAAFSARADAPAVIANDTVYIVGGKGAAGALDDVVTVPLGANGLPGAATTVTGVLNTARSGHAIAYYNNRIYVAGGINNSGALLSDTFYIPIQANGSVLAGTQVATTASAPARKFAYGATWGNQLYIVQGSGSTTQLPNLQTATIAAERRHHFVHQPHTSRRRHAVPRLRSAAQRRRHLRRSADDVRRQACELTEPHRRRLLPRVGWEYGPSFAFSPPTGWQSTPNFPPARKNHCAASWHGNIFMIGGVNAAGTVQGTVYTSRQDPTGTTPAPWTATSNALVVPRQFHSCVVSGDWLYVIGGIDGSGTVLRRRRALED